MTPTKATHAMGFEPGDTLIPTRHFSVGSGDRAQRLIAGQEHTVTQIIGTNQVAIDTGNGTELVIPTFDQSSVRRVRRPASDTPTPPEGVTLRTATPSEDSAGRRVKAVMRGRKRLGFVAPSDYGGRSGPTGKWTATATDGSRNRFLGNEFATRAAAVKALADLTAAERDAIAGRAPELANRRREYVPGEQF